MGASLNPPPKWGPQNPYPKSAADWLAFIRWLLQLYKVTQSNASVPPFPGPLVSQASRAFDAGAAVAVQARTGHPQPNELTGLVAQALDRPPYPLRQSPTVIEDTHAHRTNYAAASYPDWWYFETDTLVLYLSVAGAWQYAAGYYLRTQAQLAAYAGTLGSADIGTLVWISDYAHMLKWSGAAWVRGPGDPEHSDTFWGFGAAPSDTGWHACDGSTVNFLKYDGTIGSRVLPNAAGSACYMLLGASYSATITAAIAPTFVGALDTTSSVSAGTPAGTISTPTLVMDSYTPAGTFTGTPQTFTTSPATAIGVVNAFIAPNPYTPAGTFAGTPATLTGTISTPTFTGSPLAGHTHTVTPTGTITLGGDPIAWFEAISYYRQ